MPRNPTGLSKLRLFVAAHPAPADACRIARLRPSVPLPDHREIPPSDLHITLQFVGTVSAREVEIVRESVAAAARGIPELQIAISSVRTLPGGAASRLLAAVCDATAPLAELHARLARRLARHVRADPAGDFLPHITLARFARPAQGLTIDEAVEPMAFSVGEIRLVRSVLLPGGAEHRVLAVYPLDNGR